MNASKYTHNYLKYILRAKITYISRKQNGICIEGKYKNINFQFSITDYTCTITATFGLIGYHTFCQHKFKIMLNKNCVIDKENYYYGFAKKRLVFSENDIRILKKRMKRMYKTVRGM